MKKILLFTLLLAGFTAAAQYTSIPDVNFEKNLIALGYDSGTSDGKVLTSNINTVTILVLEFSDIVNLTGIQDFTALIVLDCNGNQLTALDVTKNTALTRLDCGYNNLTALDVTKNTALTELNCETNQLTALDVSQNTALTSLDCSYNQLIFLNLKNGKNSNICCPEYINLTYNPNLSCIQVDNKAYSDTNWPYQKDATATYSEDCSKLSTEEMVMEKVSVYPNPVHGQLFVDNMALDSVTIYSLLGSAVKTVALDGITTTNAIDLSDLTTGVYLVSLKSKNTIVNKKIVVK